MQDKPSEHPFLVNANDVEGAPVFDAHGDKLAVVKAIYLDPRSGRAEFVCLGVGGVLGLGETLHPAPWSALAYDAASNGYRTTLDKAALDAGPGFNQAGEDGFAWAARVRDHYANLTAASTAEDTSAAAPHSRPIETPANVDEKVDHLADKLDQAEDRQEALLDEGVEESFPASDPVSVKRIT